MTESIMSTEGRGMKAREVRDKVGEVAYLDGVDHVDRGLGGEGEGAGRQGKGGRGTLTESIMSAEGRGVKARETR